MSEVKKQLTLDDHIEIARAEIEKFKYIMREYPKRNPIKALAKKEEFAKKLEIKEQKLKDLLAMKQQDLDSIEAQRQAEMKRISDEEDARKAELEAAREEGRKEALKEMKKKEPVA